MKSSAQVLWPT